MTSIMIPDFFLVGSQEKVMVLITAGGAFSTRFSFLKYVLIVSLSLFKCLHFFEKSVLGCLKGFV